MLFISLLVMSAETVTSERQTFDVQLEQTLDQVSVDLQSVDLNLTAFDRTTEMLTINEAEVEISYGLITRTIDINTLKTNQDRYFETSKPTWFPNRGRVVDIQKTKALRLDLKKSGTDTYVTYLSNTTILKEVALMEIESKSGEVRIRGRPIVDVKRSKI
jgi:hypothetical protein